MILQALVDYYDRKAVDPESGIAPEGFEHKEIKFVIVLDASGNFVQIEDTSSLVGSKIRPKSFLVPQGATRSSGINSYLLWDHADYLIGPRKGVESVRIREQHDAFKKKIDDLKIENDEGVSAVIKFLDSNFLESMKESQQFNELSIKGPNISFRLNSEVQLVCQRKAVLDAINSNKSSEHIGVCLVTGQTLPMSRLHPKIKGVRNAQLAGASIVSFNIAAFCSFGKVQGENAPVSVQAAFAYTTALNSLLAKDSRQKIQVGDATTVFWSEKQTDFENDFALFLNEPPKDNPDALTNAVRSLLNAAKSGVMPVADHKARFFILGLAPNAARISVRFWHTGTLEHFANCLVNHFKNLEICHAPHERDHLSIWWLLISLAAQHKSENIPIKLAGDWIRCIFEGRPTPEALFQSALRRSILERAVTYPRAAILKACLNSKQTIQIEKEMLVSLDKENKNIGYRLGRLFATLERIQEAGENNLNATIRDRYYASASGTPASVMPILMRMKNHHLGKLHKGQQVNLEKILGEVMSEIHEFPNQMSLQDQGRFAIGYYHQRQDFFTKHEPVQFTQGE